MDDKENTLHPISKSRSTFRRGTPDFLSEPDLTTAEKKTWNSGFPPGFTVDELRHHRRKRAPGKPTDHLQLECGTFDHIKTEYKRRFKNYYLASSHGDLIFDSKDISPVRAEKPDDTFTFDDSPAVQPEYHESFIEIPTEEVRTRRRKRGAFQLIDGVDLAMYDESLRLSNPYLTSENQSQFVRYEDQDRATPMVQTSHLKFEGDFSPTTEKSEQFIDYIVSQKRGLIRNATHLKMEGDMENKTEMREQFGPLEYQARPPLCKKFTNLHLEGEMDITTENAEKFVQYDFEKRRPLMKRSTNLHLEGDLEHKPEYRQAYVEYKTERQTPNLPQHNLKIDGFFETDTENKSKFVGYDAHPPIPFLRGSDFNKKLLLGDDKPVQFAEYKEKFIQHPVEKSASMKRSAQLKTEGDFDAISESRRAYVEKTATKRENSKHPSSLHLEGRIDMNPEYKNAYVDFYKSGDVTSPGRRRRTYSQSTSLKGEGPMETYPEYKRSFVDFPRQRPTLRRPEGQLSSEGEMDHQTEKRAQYVEYPNYQRSDSLKRESEFKLDGEFECQPEYRKAYVDYLIRERMERKPRPLDNLGNQQRRAFEIIGAKDLEDKKNSSDGSLLMAPKAAAGIASPKQAPKSLIPVYKKSPTDSDSTDKNQKSSSTLPRSRSRPIVQQSARRKSISKLETQLFGPKVVVPAKQRSRSTSSPLPPISRNRSASRTSRLSSPIKVLEDDSHVRERTGSRFTDTVRVEDLAYTPCTSPIPTKKVYDYSSSRKRWSKTEQEGRSAFFVLDEDINNNKCDGYTAALKNSLHREQKWMPSWYSP